MTSRDPAAPDPAPHGPGSPRDPGARARPTGASDLLAVFLGGAVGAVARVAFATWFPADPGTYPWTTFAENVVGAFLLGLVLTILLRSTGLDRRIQLLVGTGALGAFTTYSTLAIELDQLLRDGAVPVASAYAVASLLAGLLAALGGMGLGRRIRPASADVEASG